MGLIITLLFVGVIITIYLTCEGEQCMGALLLALPWAFLPLGDVIGILGMCLNAVVLYWVGYGVEKLWRNRSSFDRTSDI